MNLAATNYLPSPVLSFDPVTEKFTGEGDVIAKANSLLTREYRKPWVVPEAV